MILSILRTRSRSRSRSIPSKCRHKHLAIKILAFINVFVTTFISQTVACNEGWFGPSCIYKDLRYHSQRIIIDNETSNPSDGHSCVNLSAGTKSVDIKIYLPTTIFWIRATLRDEDSVSEFSLVFRTENEMTLPCLEQKMVVYLRQIDVKCKASKDLIQNVIVRGSFYTTCDIFVSGGQDLTKPVASLRTSIIGRFTSLTGIQDCFSLKKYKHCHILSSDGDSRLSIGLPTPALLSWFFIETPKHSWDYGSMYNITILTADDKFRSTRLFYLHHTLKQSVRLEKPMKTFIITHHSNRGSLKLSKIQLFGSFVCESGRYGKKCENECQCLNLTAQCFPETGGCPDGCSAGLRGSSCSTPCPDFTFGPNCKTSCHHCISSCNKKTGNCQSCKTGFYGLSCHKTCPKHCLNRYCTKEGHCVNCQIGYFGATCKSKCCAGCQGQCEKTTGNCGPCHIGYSGRDCCKECLPGTFGTGCVFKCPRNCFYHGCHWKDGTCMHSLCKAGFKGAKCEQECPSGTWGLNCNRTCSSHCDGNCRHTNGYCQACKIGYVLPRCDAPCPPGTYGEGCKHKCSNCLHQPCNHTDGRCPGLLCQAGWQREKCDSPCVSGTWGINCNSNCSPNCANLGQCSSINGHCLNGCTQGFIPPLCIVCSDHVWGVRCDQQCSFHCGGEGNCERDNGTCLAGCVAKYIPPTCQARKKNELSLGAQSDPSGTSKEPEFSYFPFIFYFALAVIVVATTVYYFSLYVLKRVK